MRLFVYDMLVNVNGIYYADVCEQARWARSAGNSDIEDLCIIINRADNSHRFSALHSTTTPDVNTSDYSLKLISSIIDVKTASSAGSPGCTLSARTTVNTSLHTFFLNAIIHLGFVTRHCCFASLPPRGHVTWNPSTLFSFALRCVLLVGSLKDWSVGFMLSVCVCFTHWGVVQSLLVCGSFSFLLLLFVLFCSRCF